MHRVVVQPSAQRSSTVTYNSRRFVSSKTNNMYDDPNVVRYAIDEDPCKYISTTPSDFSKKYVNNAIANDQLQKKRQQFYDQLWNQFYNTPDGKPDKSIVHYRSKKELPGDFVPFDIETHYTKQLLEAVNIDPKLIGGLLSDS